MRVVQLAPGRNFESVQVTAQWHDDEWYTTGDAGTLGGRRPGGAGLGLPRPLVGSVVDSNGIEQFGISETVIEGAAGSAVMLSVAFVAPALPGATSAAIPLVSLSPTVAGTGGTLGGNQNLYYALTALDSGGAESGLSFTVRAAIPAGANTNEVTLTGLSFSPGTAGFHVYRGVNPSQLLRIAANVAVAAYIHGRGGDAADWWVRRMRITIMRIFTGGGSCSRRRALHCSRGRRSGTARWGCRRTSSRVSRCGSLAGRGRRRSGR